MRTISDLINQYNQESSVDTSPMYAFFLCDTKEAYVMNICGKFWAAEKVSEGFRAFGCGFSVRTKIDMKSEGLETKLEELGLYQGGEFDFSGIFSMEVPEVDWPVSSPVTSGFTAQKMFEVLRGTEKAGDAICSSFVSVLKEESYSVHYVTGTPDPRESVFKPFIFTNEVKISPLTAISDNNDTLLRKLHANRKWDQVGDLLKSLEKSCVDEVDGYVDRASNDELRELLKDCVEAEVKFYR